MEPLESELRRLPEISAEARARVLAAVRPELSRAPGKNRWRFELAAVVTSVFLLTAVIAGALLWSGNTSLTAIDARAGAFVMCGVLCAFAAVLALAPGLRKAQVFTVLAFGAASMALVLMRSAQGASSSPEWVCTATHLGVGAVPLVIGLFALRRGGLRLLSGVALGVAAGTSGAMVGELACGRGPMHVLLFHVTAWAGVVVAGAACSGLIRPRSYAP